MRRVQIMTVILAVDAEASWRVRMCWNAECSGYLIRSNFETGCSSIRNKACPLDAITQL
jgi:hypothetical protein